MSYLSDFFESAHRSDGRFEVHSCSELMDFIQHVGFLPLLDSGIVGYSAEAVLAEECRFVQFDDGSWEWPLWQWKSAVVTESECVYGKFFAGKAGFISRRWWSDFCNWRRSQRPEPEEGSIEDSILSILRTNGSMIARELRATCGFTGPKMRSRFDAFVTRLQMGCYVITEDFVYPRDKHGREYGFGWSLLTTPELLLGHEANQCDRTPEESHQRMKEHFGSILPHATDKQIERLLK